MRSCIFLVEVQWCESGGFMNEIREYTRSEALLGEVIWILGSE